MANNQSSENQKLELLIAKKNEITAQLDRVSKALAILGGSPVETKKPKKRPARKLTEPPILTKSKPKKSITSR
ncbi:hypothetical protein SAMN05216436_102159 [bacterium A37T11]|nr:hypothetical protein SAMN05216436_102159 [bacterium A37T11]